MVSEHRRRAMSSWCKCQHFSEPGPCSNRHATIMALEFPVRKRLPNRTNELHSGKMNVDCSWIDCCASKHRSVSMLSRLDIFRNSKEGRGRLLEFLKQGRFNSSPRSHFETQINVIWVLTPTSLDTSVETHWS
jgi:hypothetical protein